MSKLSLPAKIGLVCTISIGLLILGVAVLSMMDNALGLKLGRVLFQIEIALANPFAFYRDNSSALLILALINAGIVIGLVAYPVLGIHGMSFKQAWGISAGHWLIAAIPMLILIDMLVFVFLVRG